MNNITTAIGYNIRDFRKQKNLTLSQLAKKINKGLSTLAKYESGEITMDVETLYDIAKALDVHVEQLLFFSDDSANNEPLHSQHVPVFLSQVDHLFGYAYDGRNNSVLRSRYDILRQENGSPDLVYGYVNFNDYDHYRNCETTYHGYVEYDEAITALVLENPGSRMDKCTVQISAPFIDANCKWALCTAVSIHPIMPVAFKELISKEPLPETKELLRKLAVSRNDISQLKQYNMLSVHYDGPL